MSRVGEFRTLSQALSEAADDQIRRAVAMVDALPVRGEADRLIAPLRSRLARMRPARALNFTRLLFLPLDPVIVPMAEWRRGGAGLPRPALAALARTIRSAWLADGAGTLAEIDACLVDATTADTERLIELGTTVWATAARVMADAALPDEMRALGFDAADHRCLMAGAMPVLAQGPNIIRLGHAAAGAEALDSTLAAIMGEAIAEARNASPEPPALTPLLAVLLLRAPRADRVMLVAETLANGDRHKLSEVQAALDFALDAMLRDAAAGSLAHAADALRRAGAMLDDLEPAMQSRPASMRRLREVREALDTICRSRLAAALAAVMAPADAGQRCAAEREGLARDACRLARSARRIGGAEVYDEVMRVCVAGLTERADGTVERARLAQILADYDVSAD